MSRVFVSAATGAVIYVFADDHCPPHGHARHRGEDWVARVGFSYASNAVQLISIAPLKNIPRQRVVNELLEDIHTRLAECRRSWWTIRQTSCLANQWVTMLAAGKIAFCRERTPDAKQIAGAEYDPTSDRLHVTILDGTTIEVSAEL